MPGIWDTMFAYKVNDTLQCIISDSVALGLNEAFLKPHCHIVDSVVLGLSEAYLKPYCHISDSVVLGLSEAYLKPHCHIFDTSNESRVFGHMTKHRLLMMVKIV